MYVKRWHTLAVVLIAVLSVCTASAQTLPTISVAGSATAELTPVIYGIRSGLFRRHGLNVEVRALSNGAAADEALLGGSLQFSLGTAYNNILAHARGVPLQIVAPASVVTPDYPSALLVKKDSPITTAADLNGKTYGTPVIGGISTLLIQVWAEKSGISQLRGAVEIPSTAMLAALDQGRIDAGVVLGPALTRALDTGRYRILVRVYSAVDSSSGKFVLTVWSTSAAYAAANPAIVQAFTRAILEANAYVNTHRAETAPIDAEIMKVDTDFAARSPRLVFRQAVDPADLQGFVDLLYKYKVIDKRFDARELYAPAALRSPSSESSNG